jgi:hypothetical protein
MHCTHQPTRSIQGPTNCKLSKYPGVREFKDLDLDEFKNLVYRMGYTSVPRLVIYDEDDIPIARYILNEKTPAEEIVRLLESHKIN